MMSLLVVQTPDGSLERKEEIQFDQGRDYLLRDVVRGSTSVPVYFPAAKVAPIAGGGPAEYLIDGGVVANNPTTQGLLFLTRSEAVKQDLSNLSILSFGTGELLFSLEDKKDSGAIGWVQALIGVLNTGKMWMTNAMLDDYFYGVLGWQLPRYLRMNKTFSEATLGDSNAAYKALERFDDSSEQGLRSVLDAAQLDANELGVLRDYVNLIIFDPSSTEAGSSDHSPPPDVIVPPGKKFPNVKLGLRTDLVRLMSIDGGGLLGIVAAVALTHLEIFIREEVQRRHGNSSDYDWDFPIHMADYFACFAGTSAGALLATYLATNGASVQKNMIENKKYDLDLYKKLRNRKELPRVAGSTESALATFIIGAKKIFPPPSWFSPRWLSMARGPLYSSSGIEETLKDAFGDRRLSSIKADLLIPSYSITQNVPITFCNLTTQTGETFFGTAQVRFHPDTPNTNLKRL